MNTMNTFPDETIVDGWLVNPHTGRHHHLWVHIHGPEGHWHTEIGFTPHGTWHLLRYQWGTHTVDHHFTTPLATARGQGMRIAGQLHDTNTTP